VTMVAKGFSRTRPAGARTPFELPRVRMSSSAFVEPPTRFPGLARGVNGAGRYSRLSRSGGSEQAVAPSWEWHGIAQPRVEQVSSSIANQAEAKQVQPFPGARSQY